MRRYGWSTRSEALLLYPNLAVLELAPTTAKEGLEKKATASAWVDILKGEDEMEWRKTADSGEPRRRGRWSLYVLDFSCCKTSRPVRNMSQKPEAMSSERKPKA